MKIGIWDGCANGGMMDSLSISVYEKDNGLPYAVCEVTAKQWEQWKAFLKQHDEWEQFWDKQLMDPKNRFTDDDDNEE